MRCDAKVRNSHFFIVFRRSGELPHYFNLRHVFALAHFNQLPCNPSSAIVRKRCTIGNRIQAPEFQLETWIVNTATWASKSKSKRERECQSVTVVLIHFWNDNEWSAISMAIFFVEPYNFHAIRSAHWNGPFSHAHIHFVDLYAPFSMSESLAKTSTCCHTIPCHTLYVCVWNTIWTIWCNRQWIATFFFSFSLSIYTRFRLVFIGVWERVKQFYELRMSIRFENLMKKNTNESTKWMCTLKMSLLPYLEKGKIIKWQVQIDGWVVEPKILSLLFSSPIFQPWIVYNYLSNSKSYTNMCHPFFDE